MNFGLTNTYPIKLERIKSIKTILFLVLLMVLSSSCFPANAEEIVPLTTPPSTIPELIDVLENGGDYSRMEAARVLASMGEAAAPAVPILIENLRYDGVYDVREQAAYALASIGPPAHDAVPTLLEIVKSDDVVHVRVQAVAALYYIGDSSVIPDLVELLYPQDWSGMGDVDSNVVIDVAVIIEDLAQQDFGGRQGGGYLLDKTTGFPIIALEAREWWEEEGQYEYCTAPTTSCQWHIEDSSNLP